MQNAPARLMCVAALSLLSGQSVSLAQWSSDAAVNTPVCTASGSQVQPKIKQSQDGSFYVSWFDNRSGGNDVYIQKLNSAGVPQWTADGILVADRNQSSTTDYDLEVDNNGNAILAFPDDRQGNLLTTVARIDANGTIAWQRTLASAGTFNADPKLLIMGDNSIVVASSVSNTIEIYRLNNADGTNVWGGTGRVTLSEASRPYLTGDLCRANNDGFWVTIQRRAGTQSFNPRHVYVQKFDALGVPQLPNPGAPLAQPIWSTDGLSIAFYPPAVSDGSGGLVTAWFSGGSSTLRARTARLNDAASPVYAAPGLFGSTINQLAASMSYLTSNNETYMCLQSANGSQNQQGVSAQKFDASGNPQWGADGRTILALDALPKSFVQGLADPTGYTVVWFNYADAVNFKVRATRLNPDGTDAWTASPIIDVNSNVNGKGRLNIERDGTNGAIVAAWHETRNGTDSDIFVQRINPTGGLGIDAPAGGCNPADIACDNGDPLGSNPGCTNSTSGPNEGDYNAFFAADGFFFQAAQGAGGVGGTCDIACDNGDPLSGNPGCTNNGVNEGDYNCFFNNLFLSCI
ncbi:MAG: hypothetical protein IBJ18_01780 [Phycisphaerales bacterium]|nr:hypothetical protein [Phycisphaerales bacterium]